MDNRLPAHIEVGGLIRAVEAAGGFATVLKKGERDAGTILVVVYGHAGNSVLYERMPQLDGNRPFVESHAQDPDNRQEFNDALTKRGQQDPDAWIVELDIANAQHFIAQQ